MQPPIYPSLGNKMPLAKSGDKLLDNAFVKTARVQEQKCAKSVFLTGGLGCCKNCASPFACY